MLLSDIAWHSCICFRMLCMTQLHMLYVYTLYLYAFICLCFGWHSSICFCMLLHGIARIKTSSGIMLCEKLGSGLGVIHHYNINFSSKKLIKGINLVIYSVLNVIQRFSKHRLKVACVVDIASFDATKKQRMSYFQEPQRLFWNAWFVINISVGFFQKTFALPVKTDIENSCLRVYLSYFDELQLHIKVSREMIWGVKCSLIKFFTKGCSDFFSFSLSFTVFSIFD